MFKVNFILKSNFSLTQVQRFLSHAGFWICLSLVNFASKIFYCLILKIQFLDQVFVSLLQSHFLASGSAGVREWIVPITLCCGSYATTQKFLLKTKSELINVSQLLGSSINNAGEKAWIKFNVDQTGFYRVKYNGELETRLRYAIENNELSATDRFGNFFQLLHFQLSL